MNIRSWIIFKAWVLMIIGLGFLLFPMQAFIIWGAETDATGFATARFMGQAMFLLGLMLWMLRNVRDARVHRAIASAVVVGDAVAVIIAIRATLAGDINAVGWVMAALYLALTIGFAYNLRRTPDPLTTP